MCLGNETKLVKEGVELVVANETKTTSVARSPNQNVVCRPDDLKTPFLSVECEDEKINKGSDELLAVEGQQMLILKKCIDDVGSKMSAEFAQIAALLKNLKSVNKALASLCEVPLVAVTSGVPLLSVEREGEKINKGNDEMLVVEGQQVLKLKTSIDEVGSKMRVESAQIAAVLRELKSVHKVLASLCDAPLVRYAHMYSQLCILVLSLTHSLPNPSPSLILVLTPNFSVSIPIDTLHGIVNRT